MPMIRDKKIRLSAEEQLIFGRSLNEVMAARNELKVSHPDSFLLQLVNEKIARMLAREAGPTSPWAA